MDDDGKKRAPKSLTTAHLGGFCIYAFPNNIYIYFYTSICMKRHVMPSHLHCRDCKRILNNFLINVPDCVLSTRSRSLQGKTTPENTYTTSAPAHWHPLLPCVPPGRSHVDMLIPESMCAPSSPNPTSSCPNSLFVWSYPPLFPFVFLRAQIGWRWQILVLMSSRKC